ncbi:MAG: hypothetical protein V1755_15120 [Chloroflexota bacterium]
MLARTEHGWRLAIRAGGGREYRLAQLDDHASRSRANFIWRPPLILSLRARVSSPCVPGTWGFGLWNDPFALACGPSQECTRLPALPQAAWFFSASARSHLSLREDKPANGFFAQACMSEQAGGWLVPVAVSFPFAPRSARRKLSGHIHQDAAQVDSDPCAWHRYELRWLHESTEFWIDAHRLLESPVCPQPPLGMVIWIDNQYAAFDPRGRIAWGVERNLDEAWLEFEQLRCGPELAAP